MSKETNITIRCSNDVKNMFHSIANKNPQFSKGDLFELMIKAYLMIDMIDKEMIKEIYQFSKANHEYLRSMILSDVFSKNIHE